MSAAMYTIADVSSERGRMRGVAVVAVAVALMAGARVLTAQPETRNVEVARLGYDRCPDSVLATIPKVDTTLDWRLVGKPDFSFCVPSDWHIRMTSFSGRRSF